MSSPYTIHMPPKKDRPSTVHLQQMPPFNRHSLYFSFCSHSLHLHSTYCFHFVDVIIFLEFHVLTSAPEKSLSGHMSLNIKEGCTKLHLEMLRWKYTEISSQICPPPHPQQSLMINVGVGKADLLSTLRVWFVYLSGKCPIFVEENPSSFSSSICF